MKEGVIAEILQTIDEQSKTIKEQADRIEKLSVILLQHYGVTREEITFEERKEKR